MNVLPLHYLTGTQLETGVHKYTLNGSLNIQPLEVYLFLVLRSRLDQKVIISHIFQNVTCSET